MIFPEKCFLSNSLSMDKVSMSNLISFLSYQTKCVIRFLLGQLMTSTSKAMADREKRGEDENTKI